MPLFTRENMNKDWETLIKEDTNYDLNGIVNVPTEEQVFDAQSFEKKSYYGIWNKQTTEERNAYSFVLNFLNLMKILGIGSALLFFIYFMFVLMAQGA